MEPVVDHDTRTLELESLRARLAEAEETIRAIRDGEVDALLIADESGERVYTLRSADAPYRALVEQMQEGAATLSAGGVIIYANSSFAVLVEAPLERVIGSSIDQFVDPADHDALRTLLQEGHGALRTRLRPDLPAPVDAHFSVSHVMVDGTEYRTLIATNLSTLVKVQRESQSKDEFLAMLAHELRNPLAPIRTGLQVLRLSPGDAAAGRVREMMERQVSLMVRLIDDLLDVSRVSRGKIELKRELVDLHSLVALAVETNLPFIEAGRHELALDIPSEPLVVEADPVRMAQVFGNLLNNAAKYTQDGGRLAVVAASEPPFVRIEVRDNGIGIAPEMLPGVFEMFSQVGRNLERSQGGLGIGLTLVRRLTEMHGGTVEAASPGIGWGSTFTIRLPLVSVGPAPVASAAVREAAALETPARRLRVLIVDDNLDGASALAMLVAMRGHETRTAHDGPAALAEIAVFSPHVVFCDIGLPGLNGYEVASRVRAIEGGRGGGRTTLVSLTGWGSDENKRHSISSGFDLHLTKPVDAVEIEALLDRACLAFGTDDSE